MQKPFTVPADGTVPYLYVTIPTNLKEDIWIRGVELKPTDRRVVHHIISTLAEGNGQAVDPAPRPQKDASQKEIGGSAATRPDASDTMMTRRASRGRFPRAPTSCCRCTTRRLARR